MRRSVVVNDLMMMLNIDELSVSTLRGRPLPRIILRSCHVRRASFTASQTGNISAPKTERATHLYFLLANDKMQAVPLTSNRRNIKPTEE